MPGVHPAQPLPMTSAVEVSFAQAAFRAQVARLARIDAEQQEVASQRIMAALPRPWHPELEKRMGEELAKREARYGMEKFNAKQVARASATVMIGGASPRLRALRSLADEIEAGTWA